MLSGGGQGQRHGGEILAQFWRRNLHCSSQASSKFQCPHCRTEPLCLS